MEALPGAHDTNNQLTFPEGKDAVFPSLFIYLGLFLTFFYPLFFSCRMTNTAWAKTLASDKATGNYDRAWTCFR